MKKSFIIFISTIIVLSILIFDFFIFTNKHFNNQFYHYKSLLFIGSTIVLLFIIRKFLVLSFAKSIGVYKSKSWKNFVNTIFWFILIIGLLNFLGHSFSNIALIGTIISAAAAVSAQNTIANLVSGFMLTATKIIKPDDYISFLTWQFVRHPSMPNGSMQSPEYKGFVVEIGTLNTKMLDENGETFYIPNSILFQSKITKFNDIYIDIDLPLDLDSSVIKIKDKLLRSKDLNIKSILIIGLTDKFVRLRLFFHKSNNLNTISIYDSAYRKFLMDNI